MYCCGLGVLNYGLLAATIGTYTIVLIVGFKWIPYISVFVWQHNAEGSTVLCIPKLCHVMLYGKEGNVKLGNSVSILDITLQVDSLNPNTR